MTVKQLAYKAEKYIGLSTDTKPTAALNNTHVSATFLEYDTGKLFITHDGTNWVEKLNLIAAAGVVKTVRTPKAIAAAGDYAADDVVSESATAGTDWDFAAIFRVNGVGGYLVKAQAIWQTTALAPRLTVYLFNVAPANCVLNDNVANTAPHNTDKASYVGRIDFPALEDLGTGISVAVATPSTVGNLPLWVDAASDADDLFGVVVTRDAITGEAATNELSIELCVEQY